MRLGFCEVRAAAAPGGGVAEYVGEETEGPSRIEGGDVPADSNEGLGIVVVLEEVFYPMRTTVEGKQSTKTKDWS
jgi:hypothetical protein